MSDKKGLSEKRQSEIIDSLKDLEKLRKPKESLNQFWPRLLNCLASHVGRWKKGQRVVPIPKLIQLYQKTVELDENGYGDIRFLYSHSEKMQIPRRYNKFVNNPYWPNQEIVLEMKEKNIPMPPILAPEADKKSEGSKKPESSNESEQKASEKEPKITQKKHNKKTKKEKKQEKISDKRTETAPNAMQSMALQQPMQSAHTVDSQMLLALLSNALLNVTYLLRLAPELAKSPMIQAYNREINLYANQAVAQPIPQALQKQEIVLEKVETMKPIKKKVEEKPNGKHVKAVNDTTKKESKIASVKKQAKEEKAMETDTKASKPIQEPKPIPTIEVEVSDVVSKIQNCIQFVFEKTETPPNDDTKKLLVNFRIFLDFSRLKLRMNDPSSDTYTEELQDMKDVLAKAKIQKLSEKILDELIEILEDIAFHVIAKRKRLHILTSIKDSFDTLLLLLDDLTLDYPKAYKEYIDAIDGFTNIFSPNHNSRGTL